MESFIDFPGYAQSPAISSIRLRSASHAFQGLYSLLDMAKNESFLMDHSSVYGSKPIELWIQRITRKIDELNKEHIKAGPNWRIQVINSSDI